MKFIRKISWMLRIIRFGALISNFQGLDEGEAVSNFYDNPKDEWPKCRLKNTPLS